MQAQSAAKLTVRPQILLPRGSFGPIAVRPRLTSHRPDRSTISTFGGAKDRDWHHWDKDPTIAPSTTHERPDPISPARIASGLA